jgi:hypothetical protein
LTRVVSPISAVPSTLLSERISRPSPPATYSPIASRPKYSRSSSNPKNRTLGSVGFPSSSATSSGAPPAPITASVELEVPKSSPQARAIVPSKRKARQGGARGRLS